MRYFNILLFLWVGYTYWVLSKSKLCLWSWVNVLKLWPVQVTFEFFYSLICIPSVHFNHHVHYELQKTMMHIINHRFNLYNNMCRTLIQRHLCLESHIKHWYLWYPSLDMFPTSTLFTFFCSISFSSFKKNG